MTRIFVRSFCAFAIGALLGSSALAAEVFLKIEGVEGEVATGGGGGGGGGLRLDSFSFGASQMGAGTSSGQSSGRRTAAGSGEPMPGSGALAVARAYDKSSPQLMKACAKGQHIGSAELKLCESGSCKVYELMDVVISSYSVSNDGGQPTEQVTLRYHQWRWLDASASRESPSRPKLDKATATPKAEAAMKR